MVPSPLGNYDCIINALARTSVLESCRSRAAKPTTDMYILLKLGNNLRAAREENNSLCSSLSSLASVGKLFSESTSLANVQSEFTSNHFFRGG